MKVGIGQDSHKFDSENKSKKLILGGVVFNGCPPLEGNSDADAVLHSITNAVSGVTCVNILGAVSDEMCLNRGIIDSAEYLKEAVKYLNGRKIVHVSVSIECLKPIITPGIPAMRRNISKLLGLHEDCVGITATSGEGLTPFGRGKGIQVISCITVE